MCDQSIFPLKMFEDNTYYDSLIHLKLWQQQCDSQGFSAVSEMLIHSVNFPDKFDTLPL